MESIAFTALVWVVYALLATALILGVRIVLKKVSTAPASSIPEPVRIEKNRKGLQSDILKEGSGPGAKVYDSLTVHYTAFLTTGAKVDSSYDRGRSFTFKLGVGAVIDGWDDALVGAKAGEKRKVTVPSELAYGKKGNPRVPPNSTIIFEIEVLKVEPR